MGTVLLCAKADGQKLINQVKKGVIYHGKSKN
jgi:hypothetical protein